MKQIKNILLLLSMISLLVGCDENTVEPSYDETEAPSGVMLSDTYQNIYLKRKGHWGTGNDRVSADEPPLCLRGGSLSIHFEENIPELKLQLTDAGKQLVFEETLSGNKDSAYTIPINFAQGEEYQIGISYNYEILFLNFAIEE